MGFYPLVNIQKANWKITIFKNGKSTIWAISIAMSNCRRVSDTGMFLQFSPNNTASWSHSPGHLVNGMGGFQSPVARWPDHLGTRLYADAPGWEAMRASELISCLKQTVTLTVTGQAMVMGALGGQEMVAVWP